MDSQAMLCVRILNYLTQVLCFISYDTFWFTFL